IVADLRAPARFAARQGCILPGNRTQLLVLCHCLPEGWHYGGTRNPRPNRNNNTRNPIGIGNNFGNTYPSCPYCSNNEIDPEPVTSQLGGMPGTLIISGFVNAIVIISATFLVRRRWIQRHYSAHFKKFD
ncbi:MAG: hypothetical protein WCF90_02685, partial [Methanomicrobiales archaeon]